MRVGGELLCAFGVFRDLNETAVEFGHALLGAGFFAVECFACDNKAMQRGAGGCFRLAHGGQGGCGIGLRRRGFCLSTGAIRNGTNRNVAGMLGITDFGGGIDETQMKQRGFRLADLLRDFPITHGLTGLTLQSVDLANELTDDVFKAREVGFGSAQAQFSFMTARMQAGNAGSFFQHAAALLGLCLNDFADAALMNQRRRTRSGRGIREQHLHIAGADFLAVDAIDRAFIALDAA